MKKLLILSLITSCACIFSACNKSSSTDNGSSGVGGTEVSGVGMAEDFFPTKVGTHWAYDIIVPDIENYPPLTHCITSYAGAQYETRGRLFLRDKAHTTDGKVRLEMTVKAAAKNQGNLQYMEGYEVSVDRDDLNIYRTAYKNVIYWAITRSGRYQVLEIVVHDPSNSPGGSYGGNSLGTGQSERMSFFSSRPGTSIGLGESHDDLLFIGRETYNGTECLHFCRVVAAKQSETGNFPTDSEHEVLNAGFEEHVWYGKGLGLVKLVQKVGATLTMKWQLVGSRLSIPDPEQSPMSSGSLRQMPDESSHGIRKL